LQDFSLRLMTFNLLTSTKKRRSHPWRLRKHGVARVFRRYQPDVVGTQEANLPQLLELAEMLPEYDFLGEGNLSGSEPTHSLKNWYCAIFYRRDRVRPAEEDSDTYWLSPTPEIPSSQFLLGTRPRLATWHSFEHIPSGREFVFGTTHLEAISRRHRRKSAQLLGRYVSRKLRQKGEDIPLFLTGDFNAVSESREIQLLGGECHRLAGNRVRLYDAWREAGSGDQRDGATFRGLGVWGQLGQALMGPRRIDYIFYRPRLAVLDARRIDFHDLVPRQSALPSDHFPVMADFLLHQPARGDLAQNAISVTM
jgi:endonuclease/exonuclease/phosphatase family metal-dependent hydrolase